MIYCIFHHKINVMKKIVIVLLACLAVLNYACKPKNIEQEIKDEFKMFADTTFHEPTRLKDIVSILPSDTITAAQFWDTCRDLDEAKRFIDSIEVECDDLYISNPIQSKMMSKKAEYLPLISSIREAYTTLQKINEQKPALKRLETSYSSITADSSLINRLNILIYNIDYTLKNAPINEEQPKVYAVVNQSSKPYTISICENPEENLGEYTYILDLFYNMGNIYIDYMGIYTYIYEKLEELNDMN